MKDLPIQTIERLLTQIEGNDKRAIKALYVHYQKFLFAFIRHQVIDYHYAEDVLQDTFLEICRKPLAYDGKYKFSTWLCGIAKNKIADKYRTNKSFITDDLTESIIESDDDLDWNAADRYEENERNEMIRTCIDKLSPTLREAMFWVFYQGRKVEEIAEIQVCSANTVKTRLFQSRKKIRHCLERAYTTTKLEGIL